MDARDDRTIGRVLGEVASRVHRLNPWCTLEDLVGGGWKHVLEAVSRGYYDASLPLAPWVAMVAQRHLHWYARKWAPNRRYERGRVSGVPKVVAWSASYEELSTKVPGELASKSDSGGYGRALVAAELRDQPRWPDALIDDRAWYEAACAALLALTGGNAAELDRLLDADDCATREELRALATRARRLVAYTETTNPRRLRELTEDEDGYG